MTHPVSEHQHAIARFRLREKRRWQWLAFFSLSGVNQFCYGCGDWAVDAFSWRGNTLDF